LSVAKARYRAKQQFGKATLVGIFAQIDAGRQYIQAAAK